MPEPMLYVVLRLINGGWWGVTMGLFFGDWDLGLAISATVYGVLVACWTWYSPDCPADAIGSDWRELTGRERRMIVRALARGEIPPQRSLTSLTARAAEARVRSAPAGARRYVRQAVAFAGLEAFVIAAALTGAPPGWVLAGAAWPVAVLSVSLYAESDPIRERARRAARANRAEIDLAPPEGVVARIRGIRA